MSFSAMKATGICRTMNRGGIACSSYALHRRHESAPRKLAVVAATSPKIELSKAAPTPITLTDGALAHLQRLQADRGENKTIFRVGVKSGGCSGMSYVMDFISSVDDMNPADTVLTYANGKIELRIDPKSLLYLFGLTLDHSDELIGGGYKFINPNAASSCGCGTSFNV